MLVVVLGQTKTLRSLANESVPGGIQTEQNFSKRSDIHSDKDYERNQTLLLKIIEEIPRKQLKQHRTLQVGMKYYPGSLVSCPVPGLAWVYSLA